MKTTYFPLNSFSLSIYTHRISSKSVSKLVTNDIPLTIIFSIRPSTFLCVCILTLACILLNTVFTFQYLHLPVQNWKKWGLIAILHYCIRVLLKGHRKLNITFIFVQKIVKFLHSFHNLYFPQTFFINSMCILTSMTFTFK